MRNEEQPTHLRESLWDESWVESDLSPLRQPSSLHGILRWLTALSLLLCLFIAASWWGIWQAVFPPPPYHGQLIYGTHLGQLTALRVTDGSVEWVRSDIIANYILQIDQTLIVSGIYQGRPTLLAVALPSARILWQVPSPANYSPPYFGGNSTTSVYIYYPSQDGIQLPLFEVFDIQSGQRLWTLMSTSSLITNAPFRDGTLAFCDVAPGDSHAKYVVRDGRSGNLRWMAEIPLSVSVQPQDSQSCYQTGNMAFLELGHATVSQLFAFSRISGHFFWQQTYSGHIIGMDAMNFYSSTAQFGMPTPSPAASLFTALDSSTGQVRWQIQGDYTPLYDPIVAQTAYPYAILKSSVGVIALNRQTGQIAWQFASPTDSLTSWLWLSDRSQLLYYAVHNKIYALNLLSGAVLWQQVLPLKGDLQDITVWYHQDRLYVTGSRGITALDAVSGRLIWTIPTVLQFSISF